MSDVTPSCESTDEATKGLKLSVTKACELDSITSGREDEGWLELAKAVGVATLNRLAQRRPVATRAETAKKRIWPCLHSSRIA